MQCGADYVKLNQCAPDGKEVFTTVTWLFKYCEPVNFIDCIDLGSFFLVLRKPY